jgi:hypothetical protein
MSIIVLGFLEEHQYLVQLWFWRRSRIAMRLRLQHNDSACCTSELNFLKGPWHEILDFCVFFIKQLFLGLFEYGFILAKKVDYEIADFVHSGVKDTLSNIFAKSKLHSKREIAW